MNTEEPFPLRETVLKKRRFFGMGLSAGKLKGSAPFLLAAKRYF
jgi:hypothetical protein